MDEKILALIAIILGILGVISLYKAFEKAGEKGWKAIVPLYNIYIMCKIGKVQPLFWIYICIVGFSFILGFYSGLNGGDGELENIGEVLVIINLALSFFIYYNFAREYDWGVFQSILFGIFYPIGIIILGLGNSVYITSKKGNQYVGRKVGSETTSRNIGKLRAIRSTRVTRNTDEGYKKCPYCGEDIKERAIKCRYCGEYFK